MKPSNTRLCLCTLVLACLLTACQDRLAADVSESAVRGGARIGTEMSVREARDPHATKSTFRGDEAGVNNWNLLVFDHFDGLLVGKYYKGSGDEVTVDIVCDRLYDYYALANVGDLTARFTVGVTTAASMAGLRLDVSVASGLPMAWSGENISFSRQMIKEGRKLPVIMTRLVGRFDIVVDKSGLSLWAFTASRLEMRGPASVTPFAPESKGSASQVKTDGATSADLNALNRGGRTVYYAVENCYGNLLPSSNTDAWKKVPGQISASAFPTYIEMGGQLRMTDGSNLSRDVVYRFYLGEDAVRNFDVRRNVTHTVTLVLTDEAVQRDEPSWKVEPGSYDDTREIAFADRMIQVDPGSSADENVIRKVAGSPASFKYRVDADRNLMQAGVRLRCGGTDCSWNDPVEGAAITLVAPAGLTYVTGKIRVRTLDGAKSDEMEVVVGRGVVRLEIRNRESFDGVPEADRNIWTKENPYMGSVIETVFNPGDPGRINAAAPDFYIFAIYSDGTEKILSRGEYTFANYTVVNAAPDVRPGMSDDYDTGTCFFHSDTRPYTGSQKWQRLRFYYSGTGSFDIVYTEDGITVTVPYTVTAHIGYYHTDPLPTGSYAHEIGFNKTAWISYVVYWNNGTQNDISHFLTPVSADPDLAATLGCVGGKQGFQSFSTAGEARVDWSRMHWSDLLGDAVGDYETEMVSTYFQIVDDRTLDHLAIQPAEVFVPDYPYYIHFVLTAFYTDGSQSDISTNMAVEWTRGGADEGTWSWFKYTYGGQYRRFGASHHAPANDGTYMFHVISEETDAGQYAAWSYPVLPATLATATYTFNGVTRSVSAMASSEKNVALTSLEITPSSLNVHVGQTASFTATARFEDGTSEDVSAGAAWSCGARLSSGGAGSFTALSAGEETVTASYTHRGRAYSATARAVVTERAIRETVLEAFDGAAWISSGTLAVGIGTRQQYRLQVKYADGGSETLDSGFSLSSSNTTAVKVEGNQTLAQAIGTSTVRASYKGTGSKNGLTVKVESHSYSYALEVLDLHGSDHTTLRQDLTAVYYAWFVTKDHGVEISRTDVSSESSWSLSSALGAVTESSGFLIVSVKPGLTATVEGSVTATYTAGGVSYSDNATLRVLFSELSVRPTSLSWAFYECGGNCAKTLQVSSNVDWTLNVPEGFETDVVSGSGNAVVSVWPAARNQGYDLDRTLTVVSEQDNLRATVSLSQEGWFGGGLNGERYWYKTEITPEKNTIQVGETFRYQATLIVYLDWQRTIELGRRDVSDACEYREDDPAVARVEDYFTGAAHIRWGTATGLKAGTTSIRGGYTLVDYGNIREGHPIWEPDTVELTVVPIPEQEPYLRLSQYASDPLVWTAEQAGLAAAKTFKVESNTDWTLSAPSGFAVTPVSGSGNSVISVYPLTVNGSTTDDRTGQVRASATGCATVTLGLKQERADGEAESD